jgi:hypothetical protein
MRHFAQESVEITSIKSIKNVTHIKSFDVGLEAVNFGGPYLEKLVTTSNFGFWQFLVNLMFKFDLDLSRCFPTLQKNGCAQMDLFFIYLPAWCWSNNSSVA